MIDFSMPIPRNSAYCPYTLGLRGLDYVEIPPAPALARHVECLWAMTGPAPEPGAAAEPVLPDGCMEIVFHVGSPFRRRSTGPGDEGSQHRSAVVGQLERALDLVPTGPVGLVAVRLRPEAASAFMGAEAGELTGTSARLTDVWEREGADTEDAVYTAPDTWAALAALHERLLLRRAAIDDPAEALTRAVAVARERDGAVDVRTVAAAAGWSTRQLARRFRREVGLSPKRFLRVLRVQKAAQLLQSGSRPIDAALACGYFDEAHLHRDFREIAGAPPGRWLAGDRTLADRFLG
jgi:AraC-like DNA-binding protein